LNNLTDHEYTALFGNRLVAIVLAAGLSSRMDGFKALLPLGGRAALLRLLDGIRAPGCGRVIVVTGHRAAEVEAAARAWGGEVTVAYNPRFSQGMFSTVQVGVLTAVEAGERAAAGALLLPVDVPLVAPATIRAVAMAGLGDGAGTRFAIPRFAGKNGHPLYIPARCYREILAYEGEGGLKAVRDKHKDALAVVETGDEGCVLDMDTREDYARLARYWAEAYGRAGGARGGAGAPGLAGDSGEPDRAPRRIFLVRHGQPEQHGGKIFLGQADVPLSEQGRCEAARAGAELLRLGARARRVYTSDLARARQTAQIVAAALGGGGAAGGLPVVPDKLFRELDMGAWDGELIGEIKAKFPEEYARRGEDLRNYRVPGGENFYDLRGRVLREFYRIWHEETRDAAPCKAEVGGAAGSEGKADLILVAHMGVIRALAAELYQEDEDWAYGLRLPTGSVTAIDAPAWLEVD